MRRSGATYLSLKFENKIYVEIESRGMLWYLDRLYWAKAITKDLRDRTESKIIELRRLAREGKFDEALKVLYGMEEEEYIQMCQQLAQL